MTCMCYMFNAICMHLYMFNAICMHLYMFNAICMGLYVFNAICMGLYMFNEICKNNNSQTCIKKQCFLKTYDLLKEIQFT